MISKELITHILAEILKILVPQNKFACKSLKITLLHTFIYRSDGGE